MFGDDGGAGGGGDGAGTSTGDRSLPGAASRLEGQPGYKEARRREQHRKMVAPLETHSVPVETGGGGRTGQVIRNPQSAKSGGIDLRQIFTGATLKKIIGLPSVMSEVLMAKVKSIAGVTSTVANDKSDVYVPYIDTISGIPGIGRLFAAANALWRLPQDGDSVMVLKPSEADGPGVPYVLHGDGGSKQAVPAWLDSQNSGTFVIENWNTDAGGTIRIRSQANQDGSQAAVGCTIYMKPDGTLAIEAGQGSNVTVDSSSGGSVVLNGGVLKVARVTDQVQGTAGPYPIANGLISGPGAPFVKA